MFSFILISLAFSNLFKFIQVYIFALYIFVCLTSYMFFFLTKQKNFELDLKNLIIYWYDSFNSVMTVSTLLSSNYFIHLTMSTHVISGDGNTCVTMKGCV